MVHLKNQGQLDRELIFDDLLSILFRQKIILCLHHNLVVVFYRMNNCIFYTQFLMFSAIFLCHYVHLHFYFFFLIQIFHKRDWLFLDVLIMQFFHLSRFLVIIYFSHSFSKVISELLDSNFFQFWILKSFLQFLNIN